MRHPSIGKELRQYRDDIISHSYRCVGLSTFKHTWTSSTEGAAIRLLEWGHDRM